MIIDQIENWREYVCLHPGLEAGFRFIVEAFDASMEDGRYDLPDGKGYVNVESYRTSPAEERKFEAHRKHIDIQFLVAGEEIIEWSPVSELDVVEPYSDERDAGFYQCAGDVTRLHLVAGRFAIFLPSDAHKPGCTIVEAGDVRKVIAKIRV